MAWSKILIEQKLYCNTTGPPDPSGGITLEKFAAGNTGGKGVVETGLELQFAK
jgi:hypothetical protein